MPSFPFIDSAAVSIGEETFGALFGGLNLLILANCYTAPDRCPAPSEDPRSMEVFLVTQGPLFSTDCSLNLQPPLHLPPLGLQTDLSSAHLCREAILGSMGHGASPKPLAAVVESPSTSALPPPHPPGVGGRKVVLGKGGMGGPGVLRSWYMKLLWVLRDE